MPSRTKALYLTCLLIVAAFLFRIGSLDVQSLWRDEVDALRFASVPWPEMASSFTRPGWNGPMYFLALRGWISVAGTTAYAMRYFSLLFGVLCVPLTYVLGTRLFSRRVGATAGLLIASSPYLIWYSQEVKMYTVVPSLVLLALYALRRAVLGHGWYWWMAVAAATSVAFYSHVLAALLIPVEVVWALLWWTETRRRWRGAVVALAVLTVPYAPLLSWQAPLAFQTRETGFYSYTLRDMVRILLDGWSQGVLAHRAAWGAVLATFLALTGVAIIFVQSRGWPYPHRVAYRPNVSGKSVCWRDEAGLLAWIVIPVLFVAIVSIRQPIFTDRYLVWVAPTFYLFIALGLSLVRGLARWGPWAAGLLLASLVALNMANILSQATEPIKADFRGATAYVVNAEHKGSGPPVLPVQNPSTLRYRVLLPMVFAGENTQRIPGLVIFQIPYSRFTFNYYAGGVPYAWADGLYTNSRLADGTFRVTARDIEGQMAQTTGGYTDVWLVASEMELWDERGLVKAWLDANGQLVSAAHFTRVDVYRYTMSPSQ